VIRRLLLPCIVTLVLAHVAVAIDRWSWQAFAGPFARWQVSSLPFYAACTVFGLLAALAMPHLAKVPWRSRRADLLVRAIVLAGAALMYMPSLVRLGELHMPASTLGFIAGAVAAPVVEEWVFRGLLWNAIARAVATQRRGSIITIVVTSLAFGFFHMAFEGYTWLTLGNAFVHAGFGALMALARCRLGGIAFGCAVHGAGNALWLLTAS